MARAAEGLRSLVPELAVLATSPLARAVETAEIVAGAYDGPSPERLPALLPDAGPEAFAAWLAAATDGCVAAVGHEPHLGELAAWLLTGRPRSFLVFRKGGACRLDVAGPPVAGSARLVWALAPGQLRRLGRARRRSGT